MRGSGVQGFRGSGVWGLDSYVVALDLTRFRGLGVQGSGVSAFQGFRGSGLKGLDSHVLSLGRKKVRSVRYQPPPLLGCWLLFKYERQLLVKPKKGSFVHRHEESHTPKKCRGCPTLIQFRGLGVRFGVSGVRRSFRSYPRGYFGVPWGVERTVSVRMA